MRIINFDSSTPGFTSPYLAMVQSLSPGPELTKLLAAPAYTLDLDALSPEDKAAFSIDALISEVKRTWREAGAPADAWPLRPHDLGQEAPAPGGALCGQEFRFGGDAIERLAHLALEKGQSFELTIERLCIRIGGASGPATTPQP